MATTTADADFTTALRGVVKTEIASGFETLVKEVRGLFARSFDAAATQQLELTELTVNFGSDGKKFQDAIGELTRKLGGHGGDLAKMANELGGLNFSADMISKILPTAAKTAVAYGAKPDSVLISSFIRGFSIPVAQLGRVMDMLDMAKINPAKGGDKDVEALAKVARELVPPGLEGFASAAAMRHLFNEKAMSTVEAQELTVGFFQLGAKALDEAAKAEVAAARARGENTLPIILRELQENLSKLGDIPPVLRAFIGNATPELLAGARAKAMASEGRLENRLAQRGDDTAVVQQKLNAAFGDFLASFGKPLNYAFDAVAPLAAGVLEIATVVQDTIPALGPLLAVSGIGYATHRALRGKGDKGAPALGSLTGAAAQPVSVVNWPIGFGAGLGGLGGGQIDIDGPGGKRRGGRPGFFRRLGGGIASSVGRFGSSIASGASWGAQQLGQGAGWMARNIGALGRGAAGIAGKLFRPLGSLMSAANLGQAIASGNAAAIGKNAGGLGAGLAGALAGGAKGALLGTAIFPGIGTAIGGFLGTALGGFVGSSLGEAVGETVGGWFGLSKATTGPAAQTVDQAAAKDGTSPRLGEILITFAGMPEGARAHATSTSFTTTVRLGPNLAQ